MKRYIFFLICLLLIWTTILEAETRLIETKEGTFRASAFDPLEVFIDVDAGEISVQKGQSPREGRVIFNYDKEQFRKEKIEEYRETFSTPYWSASRLVIDAIIRPAETRPHLISALDMLKNKVDERAPRKHGNIPL